MNQSLKLLGGAAALIAAALVGGTLIGSVLAAPGGTGTNGPGVAFGEDETGTDASEYCQVFLDTFASELGVSTDDLAPAAKAAAIAAINAAVEAGDLSQEAADRMIARIEAWDGDGCRWIGFKLGHWAHHAGQAAFLSGMWEAAAEALGIEPGELREALADATLEEVAEQEGDKRGGQEQDSHHALELIEEETPGWDGNGFRQLVWSVISQACLGLGVGQTILQVGVQFRSSLSRRESVPACGHLYVSN